MKSVARRFLPGDPQKHLASVTGLVGVAGSFRGFARKLQMPSVHNLRIGRRAVLVTSTIPTRQHNFRTRDLLEHHEGLAFVDVTLARTPRPHLLFRCSRGAFSARAGAGMVSLFGLMRPEHAPLLPTLIENVPVVRDVSPAAQPVGAVRSGRVRPLRERPVRPS